MLKTLQSKEILSKPTFILTVYILVATIVTLLKISIDLQPHDASPYTSKINNFIIFRNSFYHLIDQVTLYGEYALVQYDLYKYSPTFALLFAPFALVPTYPGAVLWAVFNALILFFAVKGLPIPSSKKIFIHWFILIELTTSIQNMQVNPLITALFMFAFIAFEKRQIALAAFVIVLSAYIKVYGVLGASLFLLYPGKGKFVAYSLLWSVLLFLAPLIFISFDALINQYKDWQHTIVFDHENRAVDISVMHFITSTFDISFQNSIRLMIQITAIGLFCIKYIRVSYFSNELFRLRFLASIMIWCIIFNHLAESATYIIAITGAAIWYITEEKNKWTLGLIIFAFVVCSLSPTDIFPGLMREKYIVPYALKALPCFLIWIRLEYSMLIGINLKKNIT
jgi:hypothetical protein